MNPVSRIYAVVFKRLQGKGLGLGLFNKLHSLVWGRGLRPDFVDLDGMRIRVPPGEDEAAHTLIHTGSYEPELTAAFKKRIKRGMTVLDIGASFGYHTLLLSRLVGPSGRVIAFEPHLLNFSLLATNVRENGCQNVYCVSLAVGGKTSLSLLDASAQSQVLSYGGDSQPCLQVAIDWFLKDLPRPNAVKMDIEGSEMSALDAMEGIMKSPEMRVLAIECIPHVLEKAGYSEAAMLDRLEGFGFKVRRLDERNLLCLRS